ncbi:MAG: SdrD B-like domain-containing protein [Bacteroidota bacterium]
MVISTSPDATVQTVDGVMVPAYCTQPGEVDMTNHTFDVGFKPLPEYDLALRKTIAAGQAPGFNPGDNVIFDIEVINQGDTVAYDIVVGDSIPTGLTFVSASTGPLTSAAGTMIDFTDNYTVDETFTIDSLNANDSVTFQVTVSIDAIAASQPARPLINYAEIQSFDDDMDPGNTPPTDTDSTPDDDFTNDEGGEPGGPSDNVTDSIPPFDEDDADPAIVPIFDVALTKVVDPASFVGGASATAVDEDELIQFDITVVNQGTEPVFDVVIYDEIPCGLDWRISPALGGSGASDFNGEMNTDWTVVDQIPPPGSFSSPVITGIEYVIAGPIAPGDAVTVPLFLRVRSSGAQTTVCTAQNTLAADRFTNDAEIARIKYVAGGPDQEEDFDSNFDEDDDTEDGGGVVNSNTDNVVQGDGSSDSTNETDPTTDDDDRDPANVEVIDVALIKFIDTLTSMPPYTIGDEVKFDIRVYNQGNVNLNDIDIFDKFPSGLMYAAASNLLGDTGGVSWIPNIGTNSATTTIAGPIEPGDSVTISIYATIVASTDEPLDAYTNRAEVSAIDAELATGEVMDLTQDADSPLDSDVTNNTGGVVNSPDDNNPLGGGPPRNEDQDNADPALVEVTQLSLGSTVFIDNNNDGLQNGADAGIRDVEVQLFDATTMMQIMTGPDGIIGTADDADPTPVTTDPMGNYLFSNLPPGDYYVVIPMAAVPTDFPISSNATSSGFTETDPDDDLDNDDEGIQVDGSGMAVQSGTITLSPNAEPVNPGSSAGTGMATENAQGNTQDENATLGLTDENGNMTLDFGFFAPVSVGDTAFVDVDGDGQQGPMDEPLGGVTVVLLDSSGDTVTVDAEGNMITGVTTTMADGSYLFGNLPPGAYSVIFDISTADNAEFYDFTTPDAGDDADDSDNSISLSDSTAQSNPTAFLNAGESDLTLDVGVVCAVEAVVAEPSTICATQLIDLTTGASITPDGLGGSWSTPDGTGDFLDSNGNVLSAIARSFGTAVSYRPSSEDAQRGSVTLVLTTNDPIGPCVPVSDQVTIQILKADCGTFPWNGNR